jgi:hypothetical protein
MKKREIYTLAIHILGLVALWKFITSLSSVLILPTLFAFVKRLPMQSSFYMILSSLAAVLFVILIGVFAYLCLFKADVVCRILGVSEEETASMNVDKPTVYHIFVLVAGLLMIMNGSADVASYEYKGSASRSVESRRIRSHRFEPSNRVSINQVSKAGFLSILQVLLGLIVIWKAAVIANYLIEQNERYLAKPDILPGDPKAP